MFAPLLWNINWPQEELMLYCTIFIINSLSLIVSVTNNDLKILTYNCEIQKHVNWGWNWFIKKIFNGYCPLSLDPHPLGNRDLAKSRPVLKFLITLGPGCGSQVNIWVNANSSLGRPHTLTVTFNERDTIKAVARPKLVPHWILPYHASTQKYQCWDKSSLFFNFFCFHNLFYVIYFKNPQSINWEWAWTFTVGKVEMNVRTACKRVSDNHFHNPWMVHLMHDVVMNIII